MLKPENRKLKIKTKKVFACQYGSGKPGTVIDLPGHIALAMIKAGEAISLEPVQKIETAVIKDPIETADIKYPIHKGAGYYILPDGRQVRGKANALKAMEG